MTLLLLHYLRRAVFLLLLCAATTAVASANFSWQYVEKLLESGQHLEVIKQLDKYLIQSRTQRDVEEWTLALLRGARVRTLENRHGSAINYLNYNQWPKAHLSQSILNLSLAKEYEAYFIQSENQFLTSATGQQVRESTALSEAQLVERINHHYKLAYAVAKKNNLRAADAQAYMTLGSFPVTVRGDLSDVIIAYWQQFLATTTYWSSQQKQQLNSLKLDDLLDLGHPSASTIKHPLLDIKAASRRLIQEHQNLGNDEAVFEVKRFYAQLLIRHFQSDEKLIQISEFLSNHLRQLGSQHPWWTMGQFQLANLQRKFARKKPLTEIHDLAVQASIIHPESLGTIRSRLLISELELSEYMITGAQTSGLDQASIDIEFKNLQKLYFKAWRANTPLPIQLGDGMKQKVITRLLAREADKQWAVDLPDQFDLRKQTIEHHPEIDQHGQWLIVASPSRSFSEESPGLQLLSMQFSEFIASASYFNKEFKVAVYQTKNGLAANNVSVDLLKIENDVEEVLSNTKTNRQGIAVLHRRIDANHFRIKIHRGDDHSIIDVPSLMSLKDEAFWAMQRAKSLLNTDKKHYKEGDTIYWSLISRAAESESLSKIKTNANQKAWLRMFDQDGKLILEKHYTTDDSGSASGEITLSRQNYPMLFPDKNISPDIDIAKVLSVEASWGGRKVLSVLPKRALAKAISKAEPLIGLSSIKELFQEGQSLDDKKPYFSVLDARNFFVVNESMALNLLRSNRRSIGLAGETDWYIYKRLPVKAGNQSISESTRSSSWMLGSIKQTGTASHNTKGKAVLSIKPLESGAYRLRVVDKHNPTLAAFEYDFIVAETNVSKKISLSGLLLTEKAELTGNNHTLRFLAGSGNTKQWSRLTIMHNNKPLASQMLSPGIHLLNFPITDAHQGGVNFFLEWVENNQLSSREIDVEVPWNSQRLSVSLKKNLKKSNPIIRLGVLNNMGRVLPNSLKSKVLLYFTEHSEDITVPSAFNLKSLYWQSRSSLMRLNNNGRSYPHYFSTPKRFPAQICDIVELPRIRYSSSNSDLLSNDRSEFTIQNLSNESVKVSYLPDDNTTFKRIGPLSKVANSDRAPLSEHSPLTHFSESYLNVEGGLSIELPKKFKGKQVHLRAIVVTPDLKTGQSTIILR